MMIASREVSGAGVGVEGQAGVGISYPEVDQVASRLRHWGRSSNSAPGRWSALSHLALFHLGNALLWQTGFRVYFDFPRRMPGPPQLERTGSPTIGIRENYRSRRLITAADG